eukprot:jgi/Picsp_1/5219/NSC_02582-R1_---NA---
MKRRRMRRLCLLLGTALASGGILGLVIGYHMGYSYADKADTFSTSDRAHSSSVKPRIQNPFIVTGSSETAGNFSIPFKTSMSGGKDGAPREHREEEGLTDNMRETRARYPELDLEAINRICSRIQPGIFVGVDGESITTCKDTRSGGGNGLVEENSAPFPKRVRVLGERHSGTNLAISLIMKHFNITKIDLSQEDFPWVKLPKLKREFGINMHKHDVQKLDDDASYYPGLTVISVKNPYDWVASMMRKCYGCDPDNVQSSPEEFVTKPWIKGDHIHDGEKYENMFQMRAKKFCNHVQVAAEKTDCVLFVRQEDNLLWHQQYKYLWRAAEMTGWDFGKDMGHGQQGYYGRAKSGPFTPIGYLEKSLYFTNNYSALSGKDTELIRAVNSVLDRDFELALGYPPIDWADAS